MDAPDLPDDLHALVAMLSSLDDAIDAARRAMESARKQEHRMVRDREAIERAAIEALGHPGDPVAVACDDSRCYRLEGGMRLVRMDLVCPRPVEADRRPVHPVAVG